EALCSGLADLAVREDVPMVDVDALLRHLGGERLRFTPPDLASDPRLGGEQQFPREHAASESLAHPRDQPGPRHAADRWQPQIPPLPEQEVQVERLLPWTGTIVGHPDEVSVLAHPAGR